MRPMPMPAPITASAGADAGADRAEAAPVGPSSAAALLEERKDFDHGKLRKRFVKCRALRAAHRAPAPLRQRARGPTGFPGRSTGYVTRMQREPTSHRSMQRRLVALPFVARTPSGAPRGSGR